MPVTIFICFLIGFLIGAIIWRCEWTHVRRMARLRRVVTINRPIPVWTSLPEVDV